MDVSNEFRHLLRLYGWLECNFKGPTLKIKIKKAKTINIILYHIILDYIRLDSGHGIGPYPPSGAELQSVQTNKY